MHARAGTDVHDVVRLADGLLVVFDDDEGVAEVPETFEGSEQLLIVLLMQPDARLVEDIEHAREPAAYLSREPDALALASRER